MTAAVRVCSVGDVDQISLNTVANVITAICAVILTIKIL
jgi:hypothetical protein